MRDYLIVATVSYLCGSIPFGYILVRLFKGRDVRETGSGNIGATNVARTAPVLGIATLLLDCLKGFLPAKFVLLQGMSYDGQVTHFEWMLALASVFAVLGHMFPVWLHFRGGKGVATAAGVYLALAPKALGFSFIVFVLVFMATKYVSLASVLSAAAFPFLAHFMTEPDGSKLPMMTAAIAIAALVIAKHHANIRRLLKGTEPKFGRREGQTVG